MDGMAPNTQRLAVWNRAEGLSEGGPLAISRPSTNQQIQGVLEIIERDGGQRQWRYLAVSW